MHGKRRQGNLSASLTLEAALILPLFLFCMIGVLQYTRVMEQAMRFAGGLSDTAQQMAVAAYMNTYSGQGTTSAGLSVQALSTAAAHGNVARRAGNTDAVKNSTMAFSSYLTHDEAIDLILTYQAKAPLSVVPLPSVWFVQRACVRGWTGREGNTAGNSPAEGNQTQPTVYVAETGTVYHTDPNCTHLKLSIQEIDRAALKTARNSSGGKYHACELCHDHGEGSVYITKEGDRYHSSLACSGLKRTVHEVKAEDAGHLHICSKCASRKE